MAPEAKAELDRLLSLPSTEPFDWPAHARPNQLPPPGDWQVWLLRAGRGFGKTRAGAEWTRTRAQANPHARIALVAPTAADARDVMVEGESGLLAISPPWFRPHYEPSKRRLTWPNGAMATTYSADEPDRLRGPQHSDAWCDEIAVWVRGPEAFDMLQFGLRLGTDPRCVITTTPRPTKLIRDLIHSPRTAETRGTTYENRANLAPAFFERIVSQYEGTRLGRQELDAELLDDNPGALWKRHLIEDARLPRAPDLTRVVVAIDPSGGDEEHGAEAGIVVAGVGPDGHGYVLEDLSLHASPNVWMSRAVAAYHRHRADRLVAEVNFGGKMVKALLDQVDATVAFGELHASRGKQVRAEPIAALYEQGRVHHVGTFPMLEDQLCEWVPGDASPDRLDALVWALTETCTSAPWAFF